MSKIQVLQLYTISSIGKQETKENYFENKPIDISSHRIMFYDLKILIFKFCLFIFFLTFVYFVFFVYRLLPYYVLLISMTNHSTSSSTD